MAKRKIGFYWLLLRNGENDIRVEDNFCRLLEYINSLPRIERKQDISGDKFCFLEEYVNHSNRNICTLLFKSAKHSYRAPLLNRNTVEERENPKTLDEGEGMKTHLLIKWIDGDGLMLLETGRDVLTIKAIIEYFSHFVIAYNEHEVDNAINGNFISDMIPREDFNEVLESMQRVISANVYVEKWLLGSAALNFSDLTNEVQDEIVIEIKAKKKRSIEEIIRDIVMRFGSQRQEIKRIRVRGKLSDETESIIDTAFIIKKEYVDVQRNDDTGEFVSTNMFYQLELLANSFNV